MTVENSDDRWQTDGKFFRSGCQRVRMNAVTYGPLPGGWPESFAADFSQMAAAGFNAVRLYEMPDRRLLDAAAEHGLKVFGGLKWHQSADFFRQPGIYSAAMVSLANELKETGGHPALAGVYVGNEIPADLVRWMGPVKVREAVEELIATGRELAPDLLFAYANYPSTEYLEPENADFTAFNVYLETEPAFRGYLKRLHHIAGDRPLVISEFGIDSRRKGLDRQTEILGWATRAALDLECAGMTVYAWSDRWWVGHEVLDWDFGLIDRAGNAKPALRNLSLNSSSSSLTSPFFSIIVCTRNGNSRIGDCLTAIGKMTGGGFETIVVDDGSGDGTADFVEKNFPWAQVLRLEAGGLSTARNAGATVARGEVLAFTDDDCEPDKEWITRLRPVFQQGRFAAAGGPNLPPKPQTWEEAVVCAAPGAPSHVMLDDEEAEHLPGCNLAVTRAAFDAIGGFDSQFHTAGDDVDFCWRLRDAGYHLGFAPGAFVWHRRRPSLDRFLRQQLGYGRAERLLLAKHPARFSSHGDAKWHGFIYGGGPVRVMEGSVIYHGPMGTAGYQSITNRMLPLRGIEKRFDTWQARLALQAVEFLQPRLRAWARRRAPGFKYKWPTKHTDPEFCEEYTVDSPEGYGRDYLIKLLLRHHWKPAGETDSWDLEKYGNRLLLATERGNGNYARTLVRFWGNRKSVTLPADFK